MNMKKILNKWQIELKFNKDCMYVMPNLYVLIIGIYKITSFPGEGAMISKKIIKV